MRAAMKADLDFAFRDCDVGRDVDQIAEDLASLRIGIAAHGFGEDAIEPTGDDEKDHVEIDLESNSGRQRIHVKERTASESAFSMSMRWAYRVISFLVDRRCWLVSKIVGSS